MKLIFILVALMPFAILSGQTNVGIGNATPDASAKLEVSSTTQGFLMPRMTEAQRNGIISPATGLMVYQTNNSDGTYYYDGTQWRNLSDNLGNHTASTTLNMDTNKIVNVPTPVAGLDAVNKDYVDAAIAGGGGGANSGCGMPQEISSESGTLTGMSSAAAYCDSLTEGGFTDWVVPNFSQLAFSFAGGLTVPGGITNNELWTLSRPESLSNYWITLFGSSMNIDFRTPSTTGLRCRCVR